MPSSLPGFEAGGHRGSFPGRPRTRSPAPVASPQVVDIVDVPVNCRGGIGDARGVTPPWLSAQKAFKWKGISVVPKNPVQPPSSPGFTREKSRAHHSYKGLSPEDSARGIHNDCWRIEPPENRDASYPLQRALVRNLQSQHKLRPGGSCAYVGWAKRQSFDLHRPIDIVDLIGREVSEIAGYITQWSANRREEQILNMRTKRERAC